MARDLRLRLNKKELEWLYSKGKKSLEDIARLYGVSRTAVWKYCRDKGLIRRTRSEARLEAQKRGKVPQSYFPINERFFSRWSPEMAYILGIIATDGCISRFGTVSLCINDKELLEKIRVAMNSNHEIKYYGHQEGLYTFNFARKKLVDDLSRLGILPKKSLSISFPNIPDVFLNDFIRGVFDGDGSVFFEKRSPQFPLRASFISASKDFIETLENKLMSLGMPERNIYQQKTKNGTSYMIRYCHKDCKTLFSILYKNVQNGLFLERKYKKFLEGFGRSSNNGKGA